MRIPGLVFSLLLAVALVSTTGCSAAVTALKYKDLDVQTRMSSSIFLPPVAAEKKTLWVDVRNTSDKELDLAPFMSMLASRGYQVTSDPEAANFRVQINVLYVGNAARAAIDSSIYAGFGAPLAGVAAGALAGAGIGKSGFAMGAGGLIGGVAFGVAEMVADSLVKKVTYSMITDIQISERSNKSVAQMQTAMLRQGDVTTVQQNVGEDSGWRLYSTRVASTAVKVNLEFEEARPMLMQGLLRSLSGIL